ncbi:hypothetical protein KIN20_021353 [Parelaphostrongylus tenuis]|uniref:U4/U6 small nuclear ribonucleoprotein Prp31 n=1 Tax=Parelaphostrongylus tenuis TaxID=148309 RepID=A0AAD5QU55_PARTN|nr:hypothetical protein KIN20_021353 [Parelaphostrongylus tenuis]
MSYEKYLLHAVPIPHCKYRKLISTLNPELERTDEVHVTAPLESDPQYRLIVRLSHLAADLDGEINVIYKFVRGKYEKRFPELETLVPNPLEYLAAELLGQILAQATCIVVSVTASTTQGKSVEVDELNAVREACDLAEKLHSTLAARVDSLHESPSGAIGMSLFEQVRNKMKKLMEPLPVKANKALPKPLDMVKTGNITGGRIRAGVVDNKTRVKMSQKMQRQMERQRAQEGVTSTRSKIAGTASSAAFTPVQGFEIINPTALEKAVNSSLTYFSSSASFAKIATSNVK